MMDAKSLWESRRRSYWQEARGYLKLILNSGFVASAYFLFLFLTVYYQQFIENMAEDFPVVEILTLLFTWRLTQGSIRTFVKPADVVFLLPYEAHLKPYFTQSIRYSIVWQVAYVLLLFMAAGPMFTERIGSSSVFWVALTMLVLIKIWNMLCVWEEQRLVSKGDRISHIVLRLLINGVAAYMLFVGAPYMLLVVLFALMAVLYMVYWRTFSHKYALKWDRLIEVENSMVMFFYRIANAFTDVPQLRNKVRERNYLQWAIPMLGGRKKDVHHYLYARTFIRANDYLGTFIRLAAVGGVLIYVLPEGWMKLAIALLFTHITMMQLSTLSFHHASSIWVDLYPVKPDEKKMALSLLALRLLFVISIVFSVIALLTSSVLYAILTFVLVVLFAYYGSQTLIHRKKGKYRRVR
ncbi:ABC transporter permease [Shouchella patagoniensis]|uniref:ABC transporter permease n=1 Tax=Shouchella patagoniensis TaxID=228576 RepID=UPI000995C36C|nr:ABC transporter permease [Shouchella patagoniensis]